MTDDAADLAELERLFLDRVARDRARLAALWHAAGAAQGAPARAPLMREMADIAHGLSGAGGTFGFPAISDAAGELERLIEAGTRTPEPLAGAVATLMQVLAVAPLHGSTEPR